MHRSINYVTFEPSFVQDFQGKDFAISTWYMHDLSKSYPCCLSLIFDVSHNITFTYSLNFTFPECVDYSGSVIFPVGGEVIFIGADIDTSHRINDPDIRSSAMTIHSYDWCVSD